jgi:hypothetical protein
VVIDDHGRKAGGDFPLSHAKIHDQKSAWMSCVDLGADLGRPGVLPTAEDPNVERPRSPSESSGQDGGGGKPVGVIVAKEQRPPVWPKLLESLPEAPLRSHEQLARHWVPSLHRKVT